MNHAIYWITLGGLLLVVELLSGSGFLLFFGISAWVVAILPWLVPMTDLNTQFVVFAILAVLTALCWKLIIQKRRFLNSDKPFLNKRANQLIGQQFTLHSAITQGTGRIKIGDSIWQVKCQSDLPVGASITVVRIEGAVLVVRPML